MSISENPKQINTLKENIVTPLDYKPIYKVNKMVNGTIDTIYVFNGDKNGSKNQKELFNRIFTEEEIDMIQKHKIAVKFTEQSIHYDDSIGTIKIKILIELKKEYSIDEIYLYCQKIERLNSVSVYQFLTQNKKLELTKIRLEQFVSNIVSEENGTPFTPKLDKDIYTFDDILDMKLEDKPFIINKVLGQKFFIVENEYPFICNPYEVQNYDNFFEKTARKSLSTLNSHLLLNSGKIVNNNIYLCLAENVLDYVSQNDVSEETTIKIYYPFLYNKNINNLENLEQSKESLIENSNKIINEKTEDVFKTVDMFYNIYYLRKNELNYENRGIKQIKAIIKPEFDIKIPLEVIFKIIHATKTNPLIKYNSSTRQENVYRLYTDNIATDGRKIPYLKKATIFKLIKNIGKSKSVSVYIETNEEANLQSLVCEFDENGFITISTEFKLSVNESEIDTYFKKYINPIITEIQNLLEQSGYKLKQFTSLTDNNVEVKNITYETQIAIKKPFDIKSYKNCISSIFINETNIYKGGTFLRFKRVANFSKVTSQEAFVLEKSQQGYRGSDIIDALMENFGDDLTKEQAVELVRKVANEIQVERGVRKTDIKIKENPGFKTTVKVNSETSVITIVVENINDINYLSTIPIYLDTIVRLTQDKTSTKYPSQNIKQLCSTSEKEDIVIPDIISSSEKVTSANEIPNLEDEDSDVEYTKYKNIKGPEKPKGALSLFFDEEDNDELEEEEVETYGGDANSVSESSVSSDNSSSKKTIESPIIVSPVELPDLETSVASFGPSPIASEKSVASEVSVPSPIASEKSVSSEVSVPSPIASEKSVASEVSVPSPIASEKSVASEVSVPSPIASEKSVSSEVSVPSPKEPTPVLSEKMSEKSVSSEKSILPNINIEIKDKKADKKENKKEKKEEKKVEEKEDDEEEEEEKEEDEEEEEEEEDDEIKNIDGLKLNKPYYFQTLIEKKDPILILKEDTPQYNAYSRTCSSDKRRQPVILTDTQLDKINKEYPGFLKEEDVIKYGSNPKNKFNYVCPRFWCLKNNTLIDPKDLKEITDKNGKKELIHPTCGKVLPRGEKKVKPGYYIYEFYGEKENKRYPGFQTDKHPDGFCLPCCFDKYNTEGRIKAREKCSESATKEDKVIEKPKQPVEEDEYIKGPEKFPLEPGRWGYLPGEIQKMLHETGVDCQGSKSNAAVKQGSHCLLRHGVETSSKQSFVACISDAIYFGKRKLDENNKITNAVYVNPSIKEMREKISNAITIDSFIKYQNGNLITDFYNPDINPTINNYRNTKLFSKIKQDNPEEKAYFLKVASAFENFKNFLADDQAIIDHTYLWDIISMPNKYLFPTGVNLIIFQLPNDDITNNVQLLCPTNHYSNEFYESRKPTIMLIKEDGFYEPIYSYKNENKKLIVAKEFKEYDPQLSKTLRAIFKEIIKPFFNTICRPLDSMPNVYKAKKPLLLYDLVQKLDQYDYKIIKLVMNFNGKVIGLIAKEPGTSVKTGFVPCYPSALNENLKKNLEYVFMTDITLWNTYEDTVNFLNKLEKRSKKRKEAPDIHCGPAFKIVEDELVVGILTNTNQFIQLSQPIPEIDVKAEVNLPSIKDDNYVINSKKPPMISVDFLTSNKNIFDEERVEYVKKIKLETNFYNVFRNTIRILINDYENAKIREKIEGELSKQYIIYSEKLKSINNLLRELVKNKIQFIGDDNYYKLINEVSTCIVKNSETCSTTPNLCTVTEDGKCNLILPKKNLITRKINETIYYGRMSDELIRYNRIKSFMFQPQSYLSFGNVGYNLRDNEIIVIQSILTQEYFETLVPSVTNKYIRYNSYDEVEPIISQTYVNTIPSSDYAIGVKPDVLCEKTTHNSITSSIWKNCFPDKYKVIEYGKYHSCTYQVIIDLIKKKSGETITINQIKNDLYNEYKKYLEQHKDKIIDILIIEGKKTLGDQVISEALTFDNFIYTDNYFLTMFDLWILVQKYSIPTFFICQKFILQTKNEKHEFVGYGEMEDKFAFILLPSFSAEKIPNFKIIESDTGDTFISLHKLNDECKEKIRLAFENKVTVEDYLKHFEKPSKKIYYKRKPLRVRIDSAETEIIDNDKNNKKSPLRVRIDSAETEIIDNDKNNNKIKETVIKEKPKGKKRTKKTVILKGNQKTKKNIKKFVIDSSPTEII